MKSVISVAQLCQTLCYPWTGACQASLSITNSRSLLKLMSIALVMPCNHLILCPPLLLLTSIFPSIRVSLKESVLLIMWPKVLQFQLQHQSLYSRLISFRIDWLDLYIVLIIKMQLVIMLLHGNGMTQWS